MDLYMCGCVWVFSPYKKLRRSVLIDVELSNSEFSQIYWKQQHFIAEYRYVGGKILDRLIFPMGKKEEQKM